MTSTKSASLEDLRRRQQRGELHAPRADANALDLPEGFWENAVPQSPKSKQQVNMRVDPDILEYFRGQGKGHLTRMHAVLRSYVDAQKARDEKA